MTEQVPSPASNTWRGLGARLFRYRPFVLLIAAVAVIVFLPGTGSHNGIAGGSSLGLGSAAAGHNAVGGSGGSASASQSNDTAVSASSGLGSSAGAGPAAQDASGSSGVSTNSSSPAGGGNAGSAPNAPTGAGVGTRAALGAPDCDSARGRIKIFYFYAPPCVAPWPAGADNGGGTAPGVTAKSIKVVVLYTGSATDTVRTDWAESLAPFAHFYRTWGRSIDTVYYQESGTDEVAQRADAVNIIGMHPFAVCCVLGASSEEILATSVAHAGILVMEAASAPLKDTLAYPGYIWGASVAPNDINMYAMSDYAGKKLVGKPAKWAGDATQHVQKRVFGLVYPNTWNLGQFKQLFAKYGGSIVTAASYTQNYDPAADQEDAPAIISRLKAAGVNSILDGGDGIINIFLTKQATAQNWFPEWIIGGVGGADDDLLARANDAAQWRNAFGIAAIQPAVVNGGDGDFGFYRWYWGPNKQEPSAEDGTLVDAALLMTGIHMAGPHLTPATFATGMFSYPPTGGMECGCVLNGLHAFGNQGFEPWTNYNAWNDFAEVYWDPTQVGPGNDGTVSSTSTPGMYRYMNRGRRFLATGWLPGDPDPFDAANAAPIFQSPPPADSVPNYPCNGCSGG